MSVDLQLAKAFASIIASIQLTDYEDLDPDVTATILEPVGLKFREMSAEDRLELANLFRLCAESEPNPTRKAIISTIPEAFGLLD